MIIYHYGNMSKLPDFDVFCLIDIRKGKPRSHASPVNGNVKHKSRIGMTLSELLSIVKQSGRYSMLSVLTSPSLPVNVN